MNDRIDEEVQDEPTLEDWYRSFIEFRMSDKQKLRRLCTLYAFLAAENESKKNKQEVKKGAISKTRDE